MAQEDGSSGLVCDILGRGVEPQALDSTTMKDNISQKLLKVYMSTYAHGNTQRVRGEGMRFCIVNKVLHINNN